MLALSNSLRVQQGNKLQLLNRQNHNRCVSPTPEFDGNGQKEPCGRSDTGEFVARDDGAGCSFFIFSSISVEVAVNENLNPQRD